MSVTLNGSGSTPASEITNYRWDFGDGEADEGSGDAVVYHGYGAAGEYTATLTVTRGSETSKSTVNVTVAPHA